MMKINLKRVADVILSLFAVFLCIFIPKRRRELIWGPVPIINNKYWSKAISKLGWETKTLMREYYSINKQADFDLYFDDLIPRWIWPASLRQELSCYMALLYIIRNGSVVHLPFSGRPLGASPLWRLEAHLYRWAKIRTVLIPYGADMYWYSHTEAKTL